jgi:environmental stress-induced protein Ves
MIPVQPVIAVLGDALNNGDELEATAIMEHLVSIAQQQPMFFKGTIDDVVKAMLTVASATGLDFSTRSMALELMVTLTETAPALARRCKGVFR